MRIDHALKALMKSGGFGPFQDHQFINEKERGEQEEEEEEKQGGGKGKELDC
jgi:hypothetical protein